ncbi:MAG: phosphotransferase family protein, partial [Myxococcota bacterium]
TPDQLTHLLRRARRALRLPRLLAEAAARLHALPVEPLIARLRERGGDPAELSVGALLGDLAGQIRGLDHGELTRALAWLEHTRPPERRQALCHGDLHPNNLLVDDDGQWTLIDWTNARLAEPELDIAFTAELLELAPVIVPRAARPLVRLGLRRASRMLQAAYAARAELDPARVTWYQALYRLQLLVRVEADRAALPGAAVFPKSHPWRLVAPLAAARLRAALAS